MPRAQAGVSAMSTPVVARRCRSLPMLVAAFAGPAQAGPTAPPAPAPGATLSLPEGPWPPGAVLAADPGEVTAPVATAAASTTPCPPAPYGVNHSAPGAGKTVALTFDDGPGTTTAAILSILQQNGVPATFFNLGVNSTVRPTLVRSEAVTGQVLGNHTWDHPRMPVLTTSGQAGEMDRATAEQNALTGVAPCLFRPPYGEYNATTLSLAQQRRMAVWNWSVDTEDWKAGTSTASSWVERIVSLAVAGGSQQHPVVLMHNPPAGIPATVSALPRIIDYYRSHGYRFVDLLGGTGRRARRPRPRPLPAACTRTCARRAAPSPSGPCAGPPGVRRPRWGARSSAVRPRPRSDSFTGSPGWVRSRAWISSTDRTTAWAGGSR